MPRSKSKSWRPDDVPRDERWDYVAPFALMAMAVEAAGSLEKFMERDGDLLFEIDGMQEFLTRLVPPSRGGVVANAEHELAWREFVRLGLENFGADFFEDMRMRYRMPAEKDKSDAFRSSLMDMIA